MFLPVFVFTSVCFSAKRLRVWGFKLVGVWVEEGAMVRWCEKGVGVLGGCDVALVTHTHTSARVHAVMGVG